MLRLLLVRRSLRLLLVGCRLERLAGGSPVEAGGILAAGAGAKQLVDSRSLVATWLTERIGVVAGAVV